MTNYDGLKPGEILADADVSEFIGQMGIAIADAQQQLDTNSINQLAVLADTSTPLGQQNLLQLGFTPAFYHYQYADLSVSMQLRLQVAKSLSVDFGLNANFTDRDNLTSFTDDANSSSSNLSVGGEIKVAKLKLKSAGEGSVSLNGNSVPVTGDTPEARARNLARNISRNASNNIELALVSAPNDTFNIVPDPTITEVEKKLKITPNTIGILARTSSLGLIQIVKNETTSYDLNGSNQNLEITNQANLAAHAQKTRDDIHAISGFDARLFDMTANKPLLRYSFETGDAELKEFSDNGQNYNEDFEEEIKQIAAVVKGTSIRLKIEGFADKQHFRGETSTESQRLNRQLGQDRADEVKKLLIQNGVAEANLESTSNGNSSARSDAASPTDDINYRKADVTVVNGADYWILVSGNLTTVSPDLTDTPAQNDNGFIALDRQSTIGLDGKSISIDGESFTFSAGSANQIASNLSTAINTGERSFTSSVTGNIVKLFKKSGEFEITIASSGAAEISLSGSGTVRVSANFSRSQSSRNIQTREENSALAVGGSIGVRYARQFDLAVTGNSAINARLVSVPAPPQFLQAIQTYLNGLQVNRLTAPAPPGPLEFRDPPAPAPNNGDNEGDDDGGGGSN